MYHLFNSFNNLKGQSFIPQVEIESVDDWHDTAVTMSIAETDELSSENVTNKTDRITNENETRLGSDVIKISQRYIN